MGAQHGTPGVYVLQCYGLHATSSPEEIQRAPRAFSVNSHPAEEDRSVAQPQLVGEGWVNFSGEAERCSRCIEAASPRARNRLEIGEAYKQIRQLFYASPNLIQKFKDDEHACYRSTERLDRQRSRFKV